MSEIIFERQHVLEALEHAKHKDHQWLYNEYPAPGGRPVPSTNGFLLFQGESFPVKPLGRFANAIAGKPMQSNPTTNQFRAQFVKQGFRLTEGSAELPQYEQLNERQLRYVNVLARPKQGKFRADVFNTWGAQCIISDCTTLNCLEAAHIVGVADNGSDKAANGIPLRADIHKLFDAGMIEIDPDTLCVDVSDKARKDYGEFSGRNLTKKFESSGHAAKSREALKNRKRYESGD